MVQDQTLQQRVLSARNLPLLNSLSHTSSFLAIDLLANAVKPVSDITSARLILYIEYLVVLGNSILDAWAKPTLRPTQGEYSVIVAIFGAFGLPPSDFRLNRLRSKVYIHTVTNNRRIGPPSLVSILE